VVALSEVRETRVSEVAQSGSGLAWRTCRHESPPGKSAELQGGFVFLRNAPGMISHAVAPGLRGFAFACTTSFGKIPAVSNDHLPIYRFGFCLR